MTMDGWRIFHTSAPVVGRLLFPAELALCPAPYLPRRGLKCRRRDKTDLLFRGCLCFARVAQVPGVYWHGRSFSSKGPEEDCKYHEGESEAKGVRMTVKKHLFQARFSARRAVAQPEFF